LQIVPVELRQVGALARRCRCRAIEWGRARAAARLIEMAGVMAVTQAARSREGPLPGHARDDRDFRPGVPNRCAGCSSTAGGASPPARRGSRVHQPRALAGHAGQPPGQHHRPRQPWQLEEGRVEGLEPLVAVGSVGTVNLERPGERGRLAEELLVEVVADLPIAWATINAGVAASRKAATSAPRRRSRQIPIAVPSAIPPQIPSPPSKRRGTPHQASGT
jgi:hypothetical protein